MSVCADRDVRSSVIDCNTARTFVRSWPRQRSCGTHAFRAKISRSFVVRSSKNRFWGKKRTALQFIYYVIYYEKSWTWAGIVFFKLLFHFLRSFFFFFIVVLLSLVSRNAGPPYLGCCCCFFCRFQIFCISLLLISNSSVLWGLFSSGLSLCDDFRKKMSFLLPCISGHIKAQHSQGEDKVPCFYPWYLD